MRIDFGTYWACDLDNTIEGFIAEFTCQHCKYGTKGDEVYPNHIICEQENIHKKVSHPICNKFEPSKDTIELINRKIKGLQLSLERYTK